MIRTPPCRGSPRPAGNPHAPRPALRRHRRRGRRKAGGRRWSAAPPGGGDRGICGCGASSCSRGMLAGDALGQVATRVRRGSLLRLVPLLVGGHTQCGTGGGDAFACEVGRRRVLLPHCHGCGAQHVAVIGVVCLSDVCPATDDSLGLRVDGALLGHQGRGVCYAGSLKAGATGDIAAADTGLVAGGFLRQQHENPGPRPTSTGKDHADSEASPASQPVSQSGSRQPARWCAASNEHRLPSDKGRRTVL